MRIGSTISLEELWNYLTNGEDIPYRRVESAFGTLVRLGEDNYEFHTPDDKIACYDGDEIWIIEQGDGKVHLKSYDEEDTTFFLSDEEFASCIYLGM